MMDNENAQEESCVGWKGGHMGLSLQGWNISKEGRKERMEESKERRKEKSFKNCL